MLEFLEQEHSTENLSFFTAVENFEDILFLLLDECDINRSAVSLHRGKATLSFQAMKHTNTPIVIASACCDRCVHIIHSHIVGDNDKGDCSQPSQKSCFRSMVRDMSSAQPERLDDLSPGIKCTTYRSSHRGLCVIWILPLV
jgi:hypothetical protein